MTRDGTVGRSDATEPNLAFHRDIDPVRMMRTRFADPIRASSPPGLHQQAGHMTASDLCAARIVANSSRCAAGRRLRGRLLHARALIGGPSRLPLREPFSLLDHCDHLDLNHCLSLSETADLDRRAGRTGYPEVAHAHVGALGECSVVRDEGVGLNNMGPSRASGLEAGVEVRKGLFELRPHVARADDVALCVACQLAGDVDGLTRACDRDDVRIGGLPLLYADVHARRLDPVDLHGHNSSPVADAEPRMPLRSRLLQSGKAAHARQSQDCADAWAYDHP